MTPQHLGEVIFLKSLALSFWAAFKEAREKGKIKAAQQRLLVIFQREWDRRRASQPRLLTDQRANRG